MAKKNTWPPTKVVEVSWVDANAKSRWGSAEEYVNHGPAPVLTVGYLLYQDKEKITVVQSVGADWNDCNGAISIPTPWAIKIKVLRK